MITSIFTIISALLPILIQALQGAKILSPSIGGLITGIEGAASVVTQELTAPGATADPSITVNTLLAAISAGLQVLQTETTISPTTLLIIAAVDSAIQAGLAAVASITSVDPTKLQPIQPV
jgi:hypothetical protein